MNKNKIWLLAVMIAIVGVAVISCPPPDEDPELGSISISPDKVSHTNQKLTATYGGSENVTFQWKKDGANVGTTNTGKTSDYTPSAVGKYSVTISLQDFPDKNSNIVTVYDNTSFNGSWECGDNMVIISSTKLEYYYENEKSYVMEELEWTPLTSTKTNYSIGYKIKGKLTFEHATDPFNPNKDGSTTDEANVNDICNDFWYIHDNGASLTPGQWSTDTHYPAANSEIYTKK